MKITSFHRTAVEWWVWPKPTHFTNGMDNSTKKHWTKFHKIEVTKRISVVEVLQSNVETVSCSHAI